MMHRTRVKICGITTVADAEIAAACGADAIGLVFYPPSPRCVKLEVAAQIARAVGPFITVVGLFVDPLPQQIETVLARVPLHLIQFHGSEAPDFCRRFQRPYIKSLRVRAGESVVVTRTVIAANADNYSDAVGILLDTHNDRVAGGSGECFDWRCVPEAGRWTVAGGLNPENVGDALAATRPYAVDVSSGVESMPGQKDKVKVQRFIDNVRSADADRV